MGFWRERCWWWIGCFPMTARLHTVFEPLQVEYGRQAYPSAVNHSLPNRTQAVAAQMYGVPWSRNPGGYRVRYVAISEWS